MLLWVRSWTRLPRLSCASRAASKSTWRRCAHSWRRHVMQRGCRRLPLPGTPFFQFPLCASMRRSARPPRRNGLQKRSPRACRGPWQPWGRPARGLPRAGMPWQPSKPGISASLESVRIGMAPSEASREMCARLAPSGKLLLAVEEKVEAAARAFSEAGAQGARAARETQERVCALRLVPLSRVFKGAARAAGFARQVEFREDGIELDWTAVPILRRALALLLDCRVPGQEEGGTARGPSLALRGGEGRVHLRHGLWRNAFERRPQKTGPCRGPGRTRGMGGIGQGRKGRGGMHPPDPGEAALSARAQQRGVGGVRASCPGHRGVHHGELACLADPPRGKGDPDSGSRGAPHAHGPPISCCPVRPCRGDRQIGTTDGGPRS